MTTGMLSPLSQHDVEQGRAFPAWPAFGLWQKARPERLAREQSVTAGMLSPLLQHDVEQEGDFVPWPAAGLWQKASPDRLEIERSKREGGGDVEREREK